MSYSDISIESLSKKYFSEKDIEDKLNNVVLPFLDKYIEEIYIEGKEDKKIYCEKYVLKNSKANIVISHGFSESLEKYHELIYYFLQEGYSVYAIEHRGHGRSGSLANLQIVDDTQVNVDKFDYYIEDLKKFIDTVVVPESGNKSKFLFAHSMGGGIGALFLERHKGYFDAAILNAPMMQIHTGSYPEFIAKAIANIVVAFGMGNKYVLGHGPFVIDEKLEESATSSKNRYKNYHKFLLDNAKYQRSGASYNWLKNAFEATKEIVENAHKVDIPVMLCQAGRDTFVKSKGQNKFVENAKNCKIKLYPESKHEMYFEKDTISWPYLEDIFSFYREYLV
ncbi:alpha/beta fold hydrolase [Romboutsia weinsteinii]|nr:alpha/beta hydrolase [Romboutsia weinsteinii]